MVKNKTVSYTKLKERTLKDKKTVHRVIEMKAKKGYYIDIEDIQDIHEKLKKKGVKRVIFKAESGYGIRTINPDHDEDDDYFTGIESSKFHEYDRVLILAFS